MVVIRKEENKEKLEREAKDGKEDHTDEAHNQAGIFSRTNQADAKHGKSARKLSRKLDQKKIARSSKMVEKIINI